MANSLVESRITEKTLPLLPINSVCTSWMSCMVANWFFWLVSVSYWTSNNRLLCNKDTFISRDISLYFCTVSAKSLPKSMPPAANNVMGLRATRNAGPNSSIYSFMARELSLLFNNSAANAWAPLRWLSKRVSLIFEIPRNSPTPFGNNAFT